MSDGRDAGFVAVQRALGPVDRGRGAVIVVHGRPGSGRSTCCERIAAAADGAWDVTHVRAAPGGVIEADVAGRLDVAAGDRRALVIVDDADLVDRATGSALRDLARAVGGRPVALVLTAAEPGRLGLGAGEAHWVELAPLTSHDLAALVESITGRPPDGVALHRLGALSDGNLRTAVELIGASSPSQLRTGAGLDHAMLEQLPSTRLAASRMRELPCATKIALCAAALGGREPLGTVLVALDRLETSIDDLAAAEEARWITIRCDRVEFDHPLDQVAATTVLTFPERRRVATALAAAVGTRDELRSAWYEAIDAVAPDDALARRLHRLADRTMSDGDPLFASDIWRASARLWSVDAETTLLRAAHAAQVGGRLDDAIELANQVLAGTQSPTQRAEARRIQGLVLIWQGHPDRAHDLLAAEADRLAPRACFEATSLLLQGTLGALHAGHLGTADRLAARAAEMGGHLGPLGTAATAIAGNTRTLLGDAGGIEAIRAARDLHIEAEPFVTSAPPVLHLTSWVGRMLAELGDHEAAFALLDWTLQQADEHGYATYTLMPLAHRAGARIRRGDLREANHDVARLDDLVEEFGQVEHRVTASTLRGHLDVLEGRPGGALRLEEAIRHSRGPARIEALVALGQAALSNGDVDEAVHVLTRARDACTSAGLGHPGFAPHEADLVEALVRAGDLDQATVIAKEQARVAAHWPVLLVRGLAARSLALTATHPDREAEHAERSLELLAQAGAPIEWGRTALCRGERLRRNRSPREARTMLRAALDTFERVGTTPWATRARDELRAAGGRRREPDGAPALAGLTGREADIARAVSEGRTNREVAAALNLSPKTVENQLSRIYAKLGVRSRTEMARIVRDRLPPPAPDR